MPTFWARSRMGEVATPFPLKWPVGRPRRAPQNRKDGRFGTKSREYSKHISGSSWLVSKEMTVAGAIQRLQRELDAIRARYAVVSSNLEVRLDGLPRSGQRDPDDPGVAVYFQLDGRPHCMPCDTYKRVADNLAAIAAHIEATRAIERHGVATVGEMFAGFVALPSPDMQRPWRDVFEMRDAGQVTAAQVRAAYTRLARERHPDTGGSDAMMAELNVARDAALREVGP